MEGKRRLGVRSLVLAAAILTGVCVALGLGAMPVLAANEVVPNWGYSWGSGGEFDVDVVTWTDTPWTTQVTPRYPGSEFATFCVQTNQYFSPGAHYYAVLDTKTNTQEGKALHGKAAWLFHTWNSAALTNYRYAGAAADRAADAGQLQYVIWHYMGRVGVPTSGKALDWYNLAQSSGWAEAYVGNVRVMQLHPKNNPALMAQDHLVELVPEPATIALFAFGAVPLLPALRRRRRPTHKPSG